MSNNIPFTECRSLKCEGIEKELSTLIVCVYMCVRERKRVIIYKNLESLRCKVIKIVKSVLEKQKA